MIVGGLGDGWGEFRAGLRQLSGLSRLLRGLLRPQAVAGAQPELSSGAAGAGWGAAQRREPVGIGGHLGPGDAAFSDRGPVGRCRGHRSAAGIPGPQAGSPRGGVGVGRQRLSQAGTEVGGGSPAVLRQAGEGGQLPGGDVPGLRQPAGTGIGGQGAVSARELDLRPGPVCGGGVCPRSG